MREARYQPSATKLFDGRVLVVAGRGVDANFLSSAEIFDPENNTWSSAGSLATARYYHRATLLADGRVVVTGGINRGGVQKSVEIYDPKMNAWSTLPSMTNSRHEHIALEDSQGLLVVAGGVNPSTPQMSHSEFYSFALGRWQVGADLPLRVANPGISGVTVDGRQYFVGGYGDDGYATNQVLTFTRSSSHALSWQVGPTTIEPRHYASVDVLSSGRIIVAGGILGDSLAMSSTEILDTINGKWKPGPTLVEASWDHRSIALPDGGMIILGGVTKGLAVTSRVEMLELKATKFQLIAPLNQARYGAYAVRLDDGRVLVGGGSGAYNAQDKWLSSVEISCNKVN